MSTFAGHHALRERLVFSGVLVTETAIHVGAGDSGDPMAGTDLPVAQDGRRRPYIPGSSLRGSVRSRLEALLRGLGRRVCDPFEKGDEKDEQRLDNPDLGCSHKIAALRKDKVSTEQEAFEIAWTNACEICSLFGHTFLSSRVRFADLPLLDAEATTYVRDGVGLDRDLRSASKGILYDFEAVPAGAQFRLRLEVENADPYEAGLVLVGLDLLAHGFVTVGGKSARGLGQAALLDLEAMRFTVDDFFNGGAGRKLDAEQLEELRTAARTHYVAGSQPTSSNGGG